MIERDLERFVQQRMIDTRIPGLSLALLRGDATEERHFGFKELRRREPPRGATRYGIGSVTKVFTAVAVMQLVDEGRVGLDDPIARHLGDEAEAFGDATIRHVLAHASGLPALGWSETKMSSSWFMDGFPVGGFDDLATFMHGAHGWRTAEPGTRWQYSNEGYILLGRLLERIDATPYVDSLQRRLLGPLGMTRSTFDPDVVASDDDRVQPYMLVDEGRLVHGANLHGVMPAAGGLVTSLADMAAFARCLLSNGRTPDGRQLIDPGLLRTMASSDVPIDPPTPLDDTPLWNDPMRVNGPGLQRHVDVFGHDVWAHGGGVMGGTAYLALIPERELGVVILANAHGYPLAQLALVALASSLGEDPEALPFVRRQRLVERAAGSYAAWAASIRAELRPRAWGVELRMAFEPHGRTVPLVLLHHDDDRDTTHFLALGSGRPGRAELRYDRDTASLVYERYALQRTGDLS